MALSTRNVRVRSAEDVLAFRQAQPGSTGVSTLAIILSVREEILKRLDQIEHEENVSIVYACESGSRAWGFESTDSDWDVRFIYVDQQDWYLSIDVEEKRDVIERPINDELEISGWDLRKALKFLRKSNPPPPCSSGSAHRSSTRRQKLPSFRRMGNHSREGMMAWWAADGVVESSGDSTNQTKKISPMRDR